MEDFFSKWNQHPALTIYRDIYKHQ